MSVSRAMLWALLGAWAAACGGGDRSAGGERLLHRRSRPDRGRRGHGLWDEVRQLADRLDLEQHALVALLDWGARPALRAGASAVKRQVAAVIWNHPACPACGGAPGLSVRTGKERERAARPGRGGVPPSRDLRYVRVLPQERRRARPP